MSKIYTFIEEFEAPKVREFAAACAALNADGITIFSHPGAVERDMSALQEAMGNLWSVTYVAVLPVPFLRDFVARLPEIDRELLTKGFNGDQPHKTSLLRRVFIPMGSVRMERSKTLIQQIKDGEVVPMGTYIPEGVIHPTAPLDIVNAVERAISREPLQSFPTSQAIIIPSTLNDDERAIAEKMLEGRGMKVACNLVNIPWQRVAKAHLPSIKEKFKAEGMDFQALWDAAREKSGEESDQQEGGTDDT